MLFVSWNFNLSNMSILDEYYISIAPNELPAVLIASTVK